MGISTFLTFVLSDELYAIEVTKVREVLEYTKITHVPRMPPFMLGVINLRGSVVPVIDLRLKFGLEKTEKGASTGIIVMEVLYEQEQIVLGALADSVRQVIELDDVAIEPAPKIGSKIENHFIKGMGKYEDEFIIILDIDQVFSTEDITVVSQAKSAEVAEAKKA